MTVDPLEQHRLPVHQDLPLIGTHFDLPETDPLADGFQLLARSVVKGQSQRIEVRLLGAPFTNIFHRHAQTAAVAGIEFRGNRSKLALLTAEHHLHAAAGNVAARHFDSQQTVAVRSVEIGNDTHIPEPLCRPRIQVDVPADARQTPEILVFEIRSVAPAKDLHRDQVLTRFEIRRDIEIGAHLAVLAVTDELAVHPQIEVRSGRSHMEKDLAAVPHLRQLDLTAVRADMVVPFLDKRRVIGKLAGPGIRNVGIDRIPVAVQLPYCGNRKIHPTRIVKIFGEKCRRTLVQIANPVELPQSVEGFDPFGRGLDPIAARQHFNDPQRSIIREKSVNRLSVHRIDIGILPFASGLRRGG